MNAKKTAPSKEIETSGIKELDVYRKQKANVLVPTTKIAGLSDFHKPVVDEVYLSSNPEDGDVYYDKITKKWRITKVGLNKLSVVAGIIWHPTECRRTDNRSDRDYVSFQAVGGIRKADGTPVFFKSEFDIDMDVVRDEAHDLYSKKYRDQDWFKKMSEKNQEVYVQDKIRNEIIQKRKHKLKLCESGAMNRVIRSLLGLKSGYTKEELAKPFVMVRIVLQPDYDDKDVRKMLIERSMDAMAGIYGDRPTTANSFPQEEIIDITDESEVSDAETNNTEKKDDLDSKRIDFENSSPEDQAKTLSILIAKKGYKYADLPKDIQDGCTEDNYSDTDFLVEMQPGNKMNFYDKLMGMLDSDIPF